MYDDAPRWSEQHFKDNELDHNVENDVSASKPEHSAPDSLIEDNPKKSQRLERTLHNLMPQIAETRPSLPGGEDIESPKNEESNAELHIAHESDPWDPYELEAQEEKNVEVGEGQETVYESEFDKRHEIKDDQTVFNLGLTATEPLLTQRAPQQTAPVPIAKVLDEKIISSKRPRPKAVNKNSSQIIQTSQRYRVSLLAGVGGAISFALLWTLITQIL